MHSIAMQLATHHYRPLSKKADETSEGVWFVMADQKGKLIRCLVERSAWQARAMIEQPMIEAVLENWEAVTTLASQKLSLSDPAPPPELHLTADDLFNIPWREQEVKRHPSSHPT